MATPQQRGNAALVSALASLERSLTDLSRNVSQSTQTGGRAALAAGGSTGGGGGGGLAAGIASRLGGVLRGGITTALLGVAGTTTRALTTNLQNPNVGVGTAAGDILGGIAATFGIGTVGRESINIAEQRTAALAQIAARGGRVPSLEQLRPVFEVHRRRATLEVEARNRVAGLAAQERTNELLGAASGLLGDEATALLRGILDGINRIAGNTGG